MGDEDWAARACCPPGVDPRLGIFSQIGAIALNAVLDADIHLGESVAVFGQGVPGQIVAQLARLNGATVIAVDGVAQRLELATGARGRPRRRLTQASPAERDQGPHRGRAPTSASSSPAPTRPARGHPLRRLQLARSWPPASSRARATGSVSGRGVPPQPDQRGLLPDLRPEPGARPPLDRERLEQDGHGAGGGGEVDLGPLVTHLSRLERRTRRSGCSTGPG